ncbi:MAG: M23 family metallopeptidase [Azoarcus sp.]|nr:M23 family metallopeptidase [Azoarcus sp.]
MKYLERILFVLTLFFCLPASAQIYDAGDYPLRIERFKSPQDIQFIAINEGAATVTLFFRVDGRNIKPDRVLPLTLVLAPHQTREIVRVSQVARWEQVQLSYTHSFNVGDAFTLPDANFRYRLPFAKGVTAQVVQEPGGTLVTHDASARYAIDFGVSEGTPVTAMRAGTVIDIKDTFTAGRPDPALTEQANFVAIIHADHTVAYYLHLAPHQTLVRVGQRVSAGEPIARSGNTGYTYGPHLHVEVRRAVVKENGEVVQESVPMAFYRRTGPGERIAIKEGYPVTAD